MKTQEWAGYRRVACQRTGLTAAAAAAAGSSTKPKNVKGEYATLRVCQQSSEDS